MIAAGLFRGAPLYDGSDHRLYRLVVRGTSSEVEVLLVQDERGSAEPRVAQGDLVAAVHPRVVAVDVSHRLECCCRFCNCYQGCAPSVVVGRCRGCYSVYCCYDTDLVCEHQTARPTIARALLQNGHQFGLLGSRNALQAFVFRRLIVLLLWCWRDKEVCWVRTVSQDKYDEPRVTPWLFDLNLINCKVQPFLRSSINPPNKKKTNKSWHSPRHSLFYAFDCLALARLRDTP
jgi:hypothetical protein